MNAEEPGTELRFCVWTLDFNLVIKRRFFAWCTARPVFGFPRLAAQDLVSSAFGAGISSLLYSLWWTGAQNIGMPYGDCEAAASEAQRLS